MGNGEWGMGSGTADAVSGGGEWGVEQRMPYRAVGSGEWGVGTRGTRGTRGTEIFNSKRTSSRYANKTQNSLPPLTSFTN